MPLVIVSGNEYVRKRRNDSFVPSVYNCLGSPRILRFFVVVVVESLRNLNRYNYNPPDSYLDFLKGCINP